MGIISLLKKLDPAHELVHIVTSEGMSDGISSKEAVYKTYMGLARMAHVQVPPVATFAIAKMLGAPLVGVVCAAAVTAYTLLYGANMASDGAVVRYMRSSSVGVASKVFNKFRRPKSENRETSIFYQM